MTFIQNNYYTLEQARCLDRIVRIVGEDSTKTHCLRVRLRSFHAGSAGSYAIVEQHVGRYQAVTGWVEVLNWDIGDMYCKSVSYLSEEAGDYDIFDEDAKFLIGKALEVLNGGE
tara:strand:+ start:9996 stop:10337 length:342 start_codon:yes stop_codon:yes gene_type:complete